MVAAAGSLNSEVPLLHEFSDYALSSSFGDPDARSDVPHTQFGVTCDADQNMRVIGEEGPIGHTSAYPTLNTRNLIRVFRNVYVAMVS